MTLAGALGAERGTTIDDDGDAGPAPALLVAVTVNEYCWPLLSPETVHDDAAAPLAVHVRDDGADVTVYVTMSAPPSYAGANHATVAAPSPAVTAVIEGAVGTTTLEEYT